VVRGKILPFAWLVAKKDDHLFYINLNLLEELLFDYPYLEKDDIMQALQYSITIDAHKTRISLLPL